jgi:hypothetical protein
LRLNSTQARKQAGREQKGVRQKEGAGENLPKQLMHSARSRRWRYLSPSAFRQEAKRDQILEYESQGSAIGHTIDGTIYLSL